MKLYSGIDLHSNNSAAILGEDADDDSDANWLANMLRLDILPEGYCSGRSE